MGCKSILGIWFDFSLKKIFFFNWLDLKLFFLFNRSREVYGLYFLSWLGIYGYWGYVYFVGRIVVEWNCVFGRDWFFFR